MVELKCVACGDVEFVCNRAEEKRAKHCPRCGQTLMEIRSPGSAPVVEAHA